MRLSLLCVIGFAAFMIEGCSIRLQLDGAMARPLNSSEVDRLKKNGQAVSVQGTWFLVGVLVPRSTIEKIVRWELPTRISIDDCRTGQNVYRVSAVGVQGADSFETMRKLLASEPPQATFAMGGQAFIPDGQPLTGLCARLEGGSYTLQRIVSGQTPIKFETAAP